MKVKKCQLLVLAAILSFLSGTAIAQQCSHANGVWTDNFSYVWQLSQSGSSVSGSVYVGSNCYPYWPVYGSSSNGQVSVTAFNPIAGMDYFCTDAFNYGGAIPGPGCNTGAGTWTNWSSQTGSWSWSKTCDGASGETTTVGTWDGAYHRFNVTVNGSDGPNFGGRGFDENVAAPGSDGCYFGDSMYDPWTEVTAPGQMFTLPASNTWVDVVGWGADRVDYYRQQQSAPCYTILYQRMRLYCNTSSPVAYQDNTMYVTINEATVSANRDGVFAGNHPYP